MGEDNAHAHKKATENVHMGLENANAGKATGAAGGQGQLTETDGAGGTHIGHVIGCAQHMCSRLPQFVASTAEYGFQGFAGFRGAAGGLSSG